MKQNESLWLGVGIGCALLLLCTLCILGAAAAFLMRSTDPTQGNPFQPVQPPTVEPIIPTQPPIVGPAQPAIPGLSTADVRHVQATVTEVSGLTDVAVGASCTAEIRRHDRDNGTFWCNAQIRCGERLVYGGAEAGFFECVLYGGDQHDVVGSDQATTATDHDGAMSLNTVGGSLEVWDDAQGALSEFRLRAQVTGVQ